MNRRCCGCLESKPFLQTSAAEGVKAVKQREGLVEEIGADLDGISRCTPTCSSRENRYSSKLPRRTSLLLCSNASLPAKVTFRPVACPRLPRRNTTSRKGLDSPNMSIPSPDRPARHFRALLQPLRRDVRSTLVQNTVCESSSRR